MMDLEMRNRIVKIATGCDIEAATEAIKFTDWPSEDGASIRVKTKSGEVVEIPGPHGQFKLHGFDQYFIQLFSKALDAEYPVG